MEKEPTPMVIVRVRTSHIRTPRGARYCREVYTLKRKSRGFDFWDEEINQIGHDQALAKIENLFGVKDGIYHLVMTNLSTDWETGHVDDYDFKLLPFTEQ